MLHEIDRELEKEGLSQKDYSELLVRLLDYGVICRDESQVEQTLYDRYVRIEELVDEYLSVLGIRIQHDKRFQFIRLYPPGAQVPGMDEDQQNAGNPAFRQRLNQSEVALILVLRAQYDKALREGAVDEQGCVMVSLEGLTIAMKNLLKRSLPDNVTERKALFRKLRQMRLVQLQNEDSVHDGDIWLRIRPMIMSYVSDEVLTELMASDDEDEQSEAPDAQSKASEAQNENPDMQSEPAEAQDDVESQDEIAEPETEITTDGEQQADASKSDPLDENKTDEASSDEPQASDNEGDEPDSSVVSNDDDSDTNKPVSLFGE
ncbi:DUF4194 domain-containing protein [Thalassolituus sp.]|uniref:DUF4194 domain-containing protein n=1 Tax=Thalassolituus sp. TaxID=2030822 RepID=UPI0035179ECA